MNISHYEIDAGVRWHVEWHAKLTSTNDAARTGRRGAAHRIVAADVQTHGRGQHGRRWQAPAGEIILATFSLPAPAGLRGGTRAMAAAVAVSDVLDECGMQAEVKWPNDILVRGAKIAGVLIEAAPHRLLVGVGLNVHWPEARVLGDNEQEWTSVYAETGARHERAELLARLAERVAHWYAQCAPDVLTAYQARWSMRDQPVHIRVADTWLPGVAAGINHDASMLVVTHDGCTRHVHSSADVRHL